MYKKFTKILCAARLMQLSHKWAIAPKRQLVMQINILSFLLLVSILQVSANTFAQQITLRERNVTLGQVFKEIRKQTGYTVLWQPKTLNDQKRVNVNFDDTDLNAVMEHCLKNLDVTYMLEDKTIVIQKMAPKSISETIAEFFAPAQPASIQGKIRSADGRSLGGASVRVKGTGISTQAGADGTFVLSNAPENAILIISHLGYVIREVRVGENLDEIVLEPSNSKLDDVQVIGYGESSLRKSTGNFTKVDGEDISQSPIVNPIAALEGRVAGMIVNQTSGVPGSAVNIQIRGRTRIDETYGADESPLFIIDGVPMASGNESISQLPSAISGVTNNGISPFSTVNTSDIESIEVLKDADATAIYGSRGANGVVLITTKKGKAGAPQMYLKAVTGISKAQLPDLLSTSEYVAMRKEAFANDNLEMTNTNAYDILVWDTTRTGLAKELIGGTAQYTTIDGGISGGSEFMTYSVGGSYYRETNVYPKPVPNTRANAHMSISTSSPNKKFTTMFRGTYSNSHNQSPATDLAGRLGLAPHYKLYNEDGSIAWNEGGIVTDNPLAYMLKTYSAKSVNLNANGVLGYQFTNSLNFKTSIGYNTISSDEISNVPKSSMNPTKNDPSFSTFGKSAFSSWIVEPQLNYNRLIGNGKLNVLLGGTLQSQQNNSQRFQVSGYPGDDFLGTLIGISGSNFQNASSANSEYKYAAFFGRVTYDLDNTYIVNLSGRRDGSSRFGPNYRYSTFGAIGAAWIFTNEALFIDNKILSFGKLRGSYGTTGNDKIGDYKYIDLYGSDIWGPTYNGALALSPTSLFKPDLHWEMNKKLEVALDLGFWSDRIIVSAAWYRNRSNDPLVQYPLTYTTGFTSVVANLNDVVVQNQGLELTWDSRNIQTADFEWRTSFNLTLPQNKLLAYPGLEQSTYANRYIIGRSLDLTYIANFIGVNPETGRYEVEDINGDGRFNVTNLNGDLAADFDREPSFYGGFKSDFRYKDFALSLFFNFNKQWTRNWRTIPGSAGIGNMTNGVGNMPKYVLRRWQKPGDITDVEKFTTRPSTSSALIGSYAANFSDATYENIFYARLRTVELLYNIPKNWSQQLGINGASIFLQGQNLFTFTAFRDTDPQTVFIHTLAPLKTFVAGVQLRF